MAESTWMEEWSVEKWFTEMSKIPTHDRSFLLQQAGRSRAVRAEMADTSAFLSSDPWASMMRAYLSLSDEAFSRLMEALRRFQ